MSRKITSLSIEPDSLRLIDVAAKQEGVSRSELMERGAVAYARAVLQDVLHEQEDADG